MAHLWRQQSLALHRLVSCALVVFVHAVIVLVILKAGLPTPVTLDRDSMTVQLIDAAPDQLTAPALPEPTLDLAELEGITLMPPRAIEGSEPDDSRVNSAPVLATELPSEVLKELGRRAGLAADIQATAVLLIEISPDGRAGSVVIERSGGNDAIDTAAVAYVLQLTWIPGYLSGQPVLMTIRMAVHLSG